MISNVARALRGKKDRWYYTSFLWLITMLLFFAVACSNPNGAGTRYANATPITPHKTTEPAVSNTATIQPIITPSISSVVLSTTSLAPYEKIEAQFQVNTVARNLDLPYDPAPPRGLTSGDGISVDALLSNDNWQTTIVQPAFFYQPFTFERIDNRDHWTPDGAPRWVVRFAPQSRGDWQMRLRAQDASGMTIFPLTGALTFTVQGDSSNPYTRNGFLRVSPDDHRYFEFDDGTPFVGAGFNESFASIEATENKVSNFEEYKMNLMRIWLSGAGINGSQWTSWSSHHIPGEGYLPAVYFDTRNTFAGADVAWKLDDKNPCLFAGFAQGGIAVEPGTEYRVSARIKLENVTAPGFAIKIADWLDKGCDQPDLGNLITSPQVGTADWITVTGTFTTGVDQNWLAYLYLARHAPSHGAVYIDEVRLWREDDPSQIELLSEPNANSHEHFDPISAAKWDHYIELAQQHGVYLKLVTDEKNEWIRNHIKADGTMTSQGSNNNFYAADNTKVRWLAQAWWRYLIARWGYSTAIHSFEYVNEGDPYNGNHYNAAEAMAKYFHQNDPSHHMVTTSFWAAFPNQEFWSNPTFSDLDYADLHAYISTGWGLNASFVPPKRLDTSADNSHLGDPSFHITAEDSGNQPITPRGLVVHGPGEWTVRYWMKAKDYQVACPFGGSGGMQRVRWRLDGDAEQDVVPATQSGQDFVCGSPGGSFDWRAFDSAHDRDGKLLPESQRLVLNDDKPHEIMLSIESSKAKSGEAWISDVELVSPDGRVVPVIGSFDTTRFDTDTAWFNRAYGDLLGATSPVGIDKPLVRGETGIDSTSQQDWLKDLNKDTQGVWLHNNVWGQINAGGMIDLFWWASDTITRNDKSAHYTDIYTPYLTYRNFMEGIPINNGHYHDADAHSSDPNLRAWGQRDDVNGRMHLWVQNMRHDWRSVVSGPPAPPISGTITLSDVAPGDYQVEWWNTYRVDNPILLTQTLQVSGTLKLVLPFPLADDVGVKIERVGK